jgi:hypothetical protein
LYRAGGLFFFLFFVLVGFLSGADEPKHDMAAEQQRPAIMTLSAPPVFVTVAD